MTAWLAGMEITADRLNDFTATETTSGVSDSAGFATTAFQGRKVSGVTVVTVTATRTGAITEAATNTGDIVNTAMTTLPSGWRPQETITTIFSSGGQTDGVCQIASTGLITLLSISGNTGIASGAAVTLTASWISENG